MQYQVTAFYKFLPLSEKQIPELQAFFEKEGQSRNLRGLFILAPEGVNATVSGMVSEIESFQELVQTTFKTTDIVFKDSFSNKKPFPRYKVVIRDEIVTFERKIPTPRSSSNTHLSPKQWQECLTTEEDVVVLDTRNNYETRLGTFRGALDPKLNTFTEFPDFLEQAKIPKKKKVLMYCTGGIRCEKALLEMQNRGYQKVYQLDGGILRYLEEFPNQEFEGECFVFDHRVAVDQSLKPSRQYALCPHCGDPGDLRITCSYCQKQTVICKTCSTEKNKSTCSKNCAYHATRGTKRKAA